MDHKERSNRPVATSGTSIPRYFPGKAPAPGANDFYSDSNSEDSENEADIQKNEARKAEVVERKIKGEDTLTGIYSVKNIQNTFENSEAISELARRRLAARRQTQSDSESEEEKESGASSEDEEAQARKLLRERLVSRQQNFSESEDEDIESEDSESGEETSSSSEYESEDSITKIQKPVFISKQQRKSKIQKITNVNNTEIVGEEEFFEEQEKRRQETLRIAALQARDSQQVEIPEAVEGLEVVDDTDGLDEEEEYQLWKERETCRIEREAANRAKRELEEEYIEKRRRMTDREIQEEDKKLVNEKEARKNERTILNKGTGNHHMGAFFNDILEAKSVTQKYSTSLASQTLGHNDETQKVEIPEILKAVRERNFGRSSQTKWKGLSKEDTSKQSLWQDTNKRRKY
ncbi:hypothetical protein AYI68_g807 [Smittium mucronatum]|uniref:Micro-fibrillar-associated protein 1 C-terminal domain-containing protein n=1 Tax=Smittium mucronatum TaxID=133383 RepID=A0A1R0H746_9FUNG|nr:hypothetical protein AYI68_g807 [Smittium mucronatum]